MKNINIERLYKSRNSGKIIILAASIVLLYLLATIYFASHFFFNTVINGVNVSFKAHGKADDIIRNSIKGFRLQLLERNGEAEEITAQDIGMQYNEKNSISKVFHRKNSFAWVNSLLKSQQYYIDDLFIYSKEDLDYNVNKLNCLNKEIVNPQNVSFRYSKGSYEILEEVYGNKINKDKLNDAIKFGILHGERKLDLNKALCYENPKYTLNSAKTHETRNLLNKYVSTKITYIFGDQKEILDGSTINEWLSVDDNLDVKVSEMAVMKYVRGLSKKYDTVGITRNFKTSIGKTVEVTGGLYGWKINFDEETKALKENIKLGKEIEKEPVYSQKALPRGKNEIGNTYVEVNITMQYLWFYKNGQLLAQGPVVTGNPNMGNSTPLGVYMLNYKQKGATLTGPGYEAEVTYWMPFFGNVGIHDASWQYSYGRTIYRYRGTHGCVNAPLYLAEKIFENIEPGIPIIVYEE